MNQSELEIRYKAKVRFWYEKFIKISDQVDLLHTILEKQKIEIEKQRKLVEKLVCQNAEVIQELRELQEEQTEMSFDNISLEKQ